jgi:hypothetical protein
MCRASAVDMGEDVPAGPLAQERSESEIAFAGKAFSRRKAGLAAT